MPLLQDSSYPTDISAYGTTVEATDQKNNLNFNIPDNTSIRTVQLNSEMQSRHSTAASNVGSLDNIANDSLRSQDSFGRWMNSIIVHSPGSGDDSILESSLPTGQASFTSVDHHQASVPQQIFKITDISPSWASSTEETKVYFSFTLTLYAC